MLEILSKKLSTIFGDLFYYQYKNPKQDFDILFLHGLGGDKEWFFQQLDKGYSLDEFSWIVPDLIGHGSSAKPKNVLAYEMEQQAKYLIQVLIEEKVEYVVILAHSMSGPIAISLIEQLASDKIQKDIKIEILGVFYLEGNLDINDAFFSSRVVQNTLTEYEAKFEPWINENLKKQTEKALISWVSNLQKIGPFPIWAISNDLVLVSKSNQLLQRLKSEMTFPVYFVFGEKNKGKYSSEELVEKSQFPLLYIPEAGHFMYIEKPAIFWKVIIKRLKNIERQ